MGKKIYIGNLSYSIDNESLADLFSRFGDVQSSRVVIDRDSGRSKGFAFVEMVNSEDATNAIEQLNGSEFSGRSINVNEAKPMEPRENRGGSRGFGNSRSRY